MSCLEDIINGDRVIIGIKDYSACADPESRLFLNRDLAGMSLKAAANIAPEYWESGAQFLKDTCILAVKHVFDEFAHELSPYFNFNNIIETRDLKVFKTSAIASAAIERGIVIKRWRSEAARLFVENVYIYVLEAGTATIKIVDGTTTTEFVADLVAGLNEVRVDYKAESESIRVVFDQTNFTTYDGAWNKSGGCNTCGGMSAGKGIYVTGWDGTQEVSQTYGVCVKVHAQCYEENVLCSLLPRMYFLILYKAGILVLKEHLATNRINHIATFGKEQAAKLVEEYETEYKIKYATLVKSAYEFLRTTKGDCIKCNGTRYVQALP